MHRPRCPRVDGGPTGTHGPRRLRRPLRTSRRIPDPDSSFHWHSFHSALASFLFAEYAPRLVQLRSWRTFRCAGLVPRFLCCGFDCLTFTLCDFTGSRFTVPDSLLQIPPFIGGSSGPGHQLRASLLAVRSQMARPPDGRCCGPPIRRCRVSLPMAFPPRSGRLQAGPEGRGCGTRSREGRAVPLPFFHARCRPPRAGRQPPACRAR